MDTELLETMFIASAENFKRARDAAEQGGLDVDEIMDRIFQKKLKKFPTRTATMVKKVNKRTDDTNFAKLKLEEARALCEELGYDAEGCSLVILHKTLYHHHGIKDWEPPVKPFSKLNMEELIELAQRLELSHKVHRGMPVRRMKAVFIDLMRGDIDDEEKLRIEEQRIKLGKTKNSAICICDHKEQPRKKAKKNKKKNDEPSEPSEPSEPEEPAPSEPEESPEEPQSSESKKKKTKGAKSPRCALSHEGHGPGEVSLSCERCRVSGNVHIPTEEEAQLIKDEFRKRRAQAPKAGPGNVFFCDLTCPDLQWSEIPLPSPSLAELKLKQTILSCEQERLEQLIQEGTPGEPDDSGDAEDPEEDDDLFDLDSFIETIKNS